MSEFHDLSERMSRVENRQAEADKHLTVLKTQVEGSLASREWVKELVGPIVENTRETRHLVETHTQETRRLIDSQGKDTAALHAAHNKLLSDRAEQEKQEHEAKMKQLESQTWSNVIKDKWAPILAFALALAAAFGYIGQWMGHVVKP